MLVMPYLAERQRFWGNRLWRQQCLQFCSFQDFFL